MIWWEWRRYDSSNEYTKKKKNKNNIVPFYIYIYSCELKKFDVMKMKYIIWWKNFH